MDRCSAPYTHHYTIPLPFLIMIRCILRSLIITLISSIVVGLVILSSPLNAHAIVTPTSGNHLRETVNNLGVRVEFNVSEICTLPVYGVYQPSEDRIVICQQRAEQLDGVEHQWTERDSVVLRHESTHVLQDCNSGQRGDNHLFPLYPTLEDLREYLDGKLSENDMIEIETSYRESGADDHVIWLEFEAFATQNTIGDDAMAERLQRVCKNI